MIFRFADCELDARLGEVRRSGEPRHVEPQVFALLAFLLANRDRLVGRDELVEAVWGHRFISDASLNSRLKSARQAIGDDGREQRMIRTLRGRGFRFVAPVEVEESAGEAGAAVPAAGPAREEASGSAPAASRPPSGAARAEGMMPSDAAGTVESRPAATMPPLAGVGPVVTPLIGRDLHADRLAHLLDEAVAGQRRIVFLTGEAGIGKSALAEAFLRKAGGRSRVAIGQCVEQRGAGEAYLPVLDAVARLCRGIGGAATLKTLESLAPSWLAQMPSLLTPSALDALQRRVIGVSRERMLREMVEALEAMTREEPLVLLLEDLHWSDPSTLDLIVWLARRHEPARLLVLATVRSGEPNRHLRDATSHLRRTGCFAQIALDRWTASELREYFSRSYPDLELGEDALEFVHRRSDGNPLFVQFLIEDWIRREAFPTGADPLGEMAAQIPESLRMLVEQRLESLSPEEGRALEVASVAGFEFTAALVAAALGVEEEDVDSVYQELARSGGLIRHAGISAWADSTVSARYAFVHHLFQEIVYDRIPFSKRRRLHLKIGEALEAAGVEDEGPLANRLALHFQLAGDRPRAVRYLCLSAEKALGRSAHVEAIGHIEAALELIGGSAELGSGGEVELDLQRMLAPALLVTRGWGDRGAERAYLRAREIAERIGDGEQLGRVLYGLAYLHELRGEFSRSEALLQQRIGMQKRSDHPDLDLEAYELLSCSLFHQGRFAPALENAEAAVQAFDPAVTNAFVASLGDNAGVASHYWQALALWFLGYPDRALGPIREALRLAGDGDLAFMASASHFHAARLHYLRGEVDAQLSHAQVSFEIARRHGYPYHEGVVQTLFGSGLVLSGGGDAGIEMIQRGLATQVAAGADMERPFGLGLLAEALLRADRIAEGLDAVGEALAVVQARCRTFFWESELYRLQGEMLLRAGRTDSAVASLARAAEIAERQGARSLQLRVALSRHRAARGAAERDEAAAVLRAFLDTFEEGLDTADLRAAVEALGAPPAVALQPRVV